MQDNFNIVCSLEVDAFLCNYHAPDLRPIVTWLSQLLTTYLHEQGDLDCHRHENVHSD